MDNQPKLQDKNLAKNATFNVIYKVLNVFFPLITATYVSRVLAPEGVGKVAYAQNIVSYFLMFAILGIPSYGTREIARCRNNPQALNKLFSELMVVNTASTALSAACFYAAAFNGWLGEPTIYMVCGTQLLFNLVNIDWLYEGEEEYVYITVRSLLVKIVSVAAIFCFVRDSQDYVAYALISCLGIGSNNVFNIIHARKRVKLDFKNLELKRHLKPIMVLAASSMIGSLYTKADVTILGWMCSEEVVGYYTNAHKIVNIGLTLVTAMSAVFMPRLSYLYKQDRKAFVELISAGAKVVLFLAVPCCVGLTLVAEDLIVAAFGPLFQPAVQAMQVLAFRVVIIGAGDLLCYQMIISSGNEKVLIKSRIIASISNIVLNLVLIPRFMHMGAAIASVASEMIVNGMMLRHVLSIAKPKLSRSFCGSLAAGTALMALAVVGVQMLSMRPIWSLIVSVITGVAIYFASEIILKNEITQYVLSAIKNRMAK